MFQHADTRSTVPIVQSEIVGPQIQIDSETIATLLAEYLAFLLHHRGLRPATLYFHRDGANGFFSISASIFRIVISLG
jgi:hypothetical protein